MRMVKGGTVARLAVLRMQAGIYNNPRPPSMARDWRAMRYDTFNTSQCMQGFNGKTPVWYSHDGEAFRNERFADDVARMDHRGWFTDTDQNDTARGIVAGLTHGRFIAGYFLSMNDERVYFPEIFTDETDCARMADTHARIIGEAEHEHAVRFDEAQTLESEVEEAITRLRECIVLRHVTCMEYVRNEITDLIETIRENRETLKADYAGVL